MISRVPTLWRRIPLFLALLASGPERAPAALVINEIMFRPPGTPEPLGQEYIELLNTSTDPVDLTGARIDRGVVFTFPAGTTIAPGACLVVTADRAAFDAAHPGVPASKVLAPWTGSLSNSGETLQLTAADGVTVLALVRYSTEGDWATRTRVSVSGQPGWEWTSPADGTGQSLELVNPLINPGNGQSWSAGAAAGGTPCAVNSTAAATIAPVISSVEHSPAVPRSTDTVKVRANVAGMPGTTVTATLYWRISNASPGPFQTTPMKGVGGERWEAELPAQPLSTVVEFYVSAGDGTRTRTWPAPAGTGQSANCLYQVDERAGQAGVAQYRLIMSVPEATQFNSMTTHTDAAVNATFIGDDGTGPAIRYLSGLRYRGASSRDFVPAPNRITLPQDRPWNGTTKMNLNSKFTWLQLIGMKLMHTSGLRAPETRRVVLTRNGVSPMGAGTAVENYGSWVHVEPLGAEFVENHFPLDDNGDLYKKVRPDNDWAYRNGSGAAYATDGWIKSTNSAAGDWTKLDNLLRVMNQSQTAGNYFDQVQEVADVQQWARWFAAETLLTNGETNASNGTDDDYSLFFGKSSVAQFVPHDLDTILGQGDASRITNTQNTLFDMTERGDALGPLLPLFGTATGGGNAEFRALYLRTLRDLCLTSFSAARYDALLDQHLTGWLPPAKITELKTFMNARRTWVLAQCATALGEATPPAPAGTAQSVTTLDRPAVSLNEVLAKATGSAADFVEVRNNTAATADLSGMKLVVTPTNVSYEFPRSISLAAGACMALRVNDGKPSLPPEFDLDADGGSVTLYNSAANGQSVVDRISWGVQAPDHAIGRTGADGRSWTLVAPTPGLDNGPALTLGSTAGLVINEWMAAPQNRGTRDFIEIFNPSTNPVAMGGLRLTDDPVNYPQRHIMANLSFIAPNAFDVFEAVGDSATPGNGRELPFALSAGHDWICLRGNNSAVIDEVNIAGQAPDLPQGRIPDGTPAFTAFELPTPGMANASPEKIASDPAYANAAALASQLRITEVMYHPNSIANEEAEEFIEFKNTGTAPLNLTGVRITAGVSFEFPAMTLAPGAYTLVVASIARFKEVYGADLPVAGQMTGQLSNSGERITVKLPPPFESDVQTFVYEDDWYPETDGGGRSLVIRSSGEPLTLWGKREGWVPGDTGGGTPGSPGVPVITSPATASGTVGVAFNYRIEAANEPVSFAASALPAGLTVEAATGIISGIPADPGAIVITVSATSSAGTQSAPVTLTISLPPAPVITGNLAVSASLTAPFSYTIAATNNPTSFTATNLPEWLQFNPATHTLSGQPTVTGTYTVTISAGNRGGTDTRELVIQVQSDAIAAALDGLGLTYTRGGNAQWYVRTSPSHDGVDSLQSGDISDSEESWLETTVTGPDILSFWWRVESESGYDFLNLNVDGAGERSISGNVDWTHVDYSVPEGVHTIRWVYRKDTSESLGADAGWLDEVRLASQVAEPVMVSPYTATAFQGEMFSWQITATRSPTSFAATGLPPGLSIETQTGLITGTPTVVGSSQVSITITGPTGTGTYGLRIDVTSSNASVSEAVDGANVVLNRGGDSYWYSQTSTTHDGVDAIRSGPLNSGQENWVELPVTGPDRVWFWWRVSASTYNDYLYFEVDNTWQSYMTEDLGWQQVTYDVPPGEHTLRWRFQKRSSATTGLDGAFLDQIVVASLLPEPAIISASSVTGEVGEPFTYQILATKSPQSYTAAPLPAGLSLDPATGLISGTPTATGSTTATISATADVLTGTATVGIHIASSRNDIMAALDSPGIEYDSRAGLRLWGAQSAVSRDGTDAAMAPFLPGAGSNSGNYPSSSLAVKVSGPDRLGFWWKMGNSSSYMYVVVDDEYGEYIYGTVDWRQKLVDLGPGEHTIRWEYYQFSELAAGTPTAWVDKVQLASQEPLITSPVAVQAITRRPFSYQITASGNPQSFTAAGLPGGLSLNQATGLISGTPTGTGVFRTVLGGLTAQGTGDGYVDIGVAPDPAGLAVGGDGAGLEWGHTPASNNLWFTQTANTHDGVDALQSGTISHNQSTGFSVTVQGRGTLRGWWRASSEQWSDTLTCMLNGNYTNQISGTTPWQELSVDVYSSGSNVIEFLYQKDGGTSSGSDACWVDQLSFTPADSDADGLSDAWEARYFPNPASAAAAGDADGDGWTNAQEQVAGTSPVDAASSLRMLSGTRAGNGFNLHWASVPGRTYLFQSSPDLFTWTTQPFRYYASAEESSATLYPVTAATSNLAFIASNSEVKAFVPTQDIGALWQGGDEAAFSEAGGETGWLSGIQGVGYENDPNASGTNVPYTSYIGLDVKSRMFNMRTGVYIRLHFPVANPELVKSLVFGLRYDDGFAAYLNGIRIAADNAPANPVWSSAASTSRADSSAVTFKTFDLSGWTQLLQAGDNVLAIHGMNQTTSSSDLLFQAQLTGTLYNVQPPPPKLYWRTAPQ